MPISSVIGKAVVRIASAIGISYRHDRGMRFSNKYELCNKLFSYALNYLFAIKKNMCLAIEVHSKNIFWITTFFYYLCYDNYFLITHRHVW